MDKMIYDKLVMMAAGLTNPKRPIQNVRQSFAAWVSTLWKLDAQAFEQDVAALVEDNNRSDWKRALEEVEQELQDVWVHIGSSRDNAEPVDYDWVQKVLLSARDRMKEIS